MSGVREEECISADRDHSVGDNRHFDRCGCPIPVPLNLLFPASQLVSTLVLDELNPNGHILPHGTRRIEAV